MDLWYPLLWVLVFLSGLAAPYGLFRLCVWLVVRSRLYDKYERSGSSAASCFVALQKIIEPPVHHVVKVKEEKRSTAVNEVPGHDGSSAKGETPG